MFCIAAFVIFAILGVFSASYRPLARKAWGCVIKRMTFKPCDMNLQEELKSRLLGKIIITKPRLAKFLDRWIGVLSLAFVALSVWSLLSVMNSGLNLFVYDTCDPRNVESCSLAGDACGIDADRIDFWIALKEGRPLAWAVSEASALAETIAKIPNRLKKWDPAQYVSDTAAYYKPFDPAKPTALEIIDPSCKFCAQLFADIKATGFADRYNLTYLAYPIPKARNGAYRFPHSRLIASYMEAVKKYPLDDAPPADWRILEKIFMETDADGLAYQAKFNSEYSADEAERVLLSWLGEFGYTEKQIKAIRESSLSEDVSASLARQKEIVEQRIQTIKIPTIMFDGRRFDRAVGPETLR